MCASARWKAYCSIWMLILLQSWPFWVTSHLSWRAYGSITLYLLCTKLRQAATHWLLTLVCLLSLNGCILPLNVYGKNCLWNLWLSVWVDYFLEITLLLLQFLQLRHILKKLLALLFLFVFIQLYSISCIHTFKLLSRFLLEWIIEIILWAITSMGGESSRGGVRVVSCWHHEHRVQNLLRRRHLKHVLRSASHLARDWLILVNVSRGCIKGSCWVDHRL